MKIPKFFYIKGNKWKVVRKKDLKHEDGDECLGLADPEIKTIFLESSLKDLQLELTFWHEYGHAMMSEAGIVNTTNGVPPLAEEIMCDLIAEAFTKDKDVKFKRIKK